MKELLTTEQLLQGLKHYRRIARQDVLRANEMPHPEAFLLHAEERRRIYAELGEYAEQHGTQEAIEEAIRRYELLPFATGTAEHEYADLKGQENALENIFLLVGLNPKRRREARNKRPKRSALVTP